MALIRQADARDKARDAIVLDLGDLMRQGDQIKGAATARAAQIIAEAEAERRRLLSGALEEGRAEGQRQGHSDGLARGSAEGREEALRQFGQRLEAIEKAWGAALEEFLSRRAQMLREAQNDLLTLGALAAEKVTRRAARLDGGAVVEQLASVLSLIARPTRLRVSVSPEDEPVLREALPSLVARFSAAEHVELTADAALAPGSCIARTAGGGTIDASLETQIARIVEAILPGRAGAPAAVEGAP